MPPQTDWELFSHEVMEDRRKGKRVTLTFPIEVSGFDRTGRLFSERTVTLDISEAGCRFHLKTQIERGDVVAVKLLSRRDLSLPPARPLLFQVIWIDREEDGWVAGALKLQPEDIWHMAFPPSNHPKTPPA